ncbi:domain found in IF2B/IF5-domain-containing protein [Clohesyomyces aquaticus]|uniref:Domain found in IF2B/IF5-domain-containing protein n=1 Tax=Clohesyomyces aquaticus TaxID=1231657 RepID=A0A1Y2A3V9_9PLEO|nr:domain found in IF2B/IF5-domain-containing protein [Clohesyomyces aquaticus]
MSYVVPRGVALALTWKQIGGDADLFRIRLARVTQPHSLSHYTVSTPDLLLLPSYRISHMNSRHINSLTNNLDQENTEFEVLAAFVKKRPKSRSKLPTSSPTNTTVLADFSVDNPITGKGAFAHNAQYALPYHLLLSRLYLQRDYYPSLNTYGTQDARNISLHVTTERKITTIGNWTEFCKSIQREKTHILKHILAELGTNWKPNIEESGALIIKGRFQQKQIHNVLRRYEKIYVQCKKCDSRNTTLGTTDRPQQPRFLVCHVCKSEYETPRIRTGFVNRIPKVRCKVPNPSPPEEEREREPEMEIEAFRGPGRNCFDVINVKARL